MEATDLQRLYLDLTTPHVADAIMRLGLPVRQAPADIAPLWQGTHLVGRALPAQHAGSVDVFLEAFELSQTSEATSSSWASSSRYRSVQATIMPWSALRLAPSSLWRV